MDREKQNTLVLDTNTEFVVGIILGITAWPVQFYHVTDYIDAMYPTVKKAEFLELYDDTTVDTLQLMLHFDTEEDKMAFILRYI